jgi:hypothetical protein
LADGAGGTENGESFQNILCFLLETIIARIPTELTNTSVIRSSMGYGSGEQQAHSTRHR